MWTVLNDATLPSWTADLRRPPARLYVRGELPRLPMVAIVGTREPSRAAAAFTRRLAGELSDNGVPVVSGGAKGIDTAAHQGVVARGGRTVVCLPCGIERAHPVENRRLFRRVVLLGGALVSREPPTAAASTNSYFPRNEMLIAMSQLLVVVEAGVRSGALNAAAHARRLQTPVLVACHPPWHKKGIGCMVELGRGAEPLRGSAQVLKLLQSRGNWVRPATGVARQLVLAVDPPPDPTPSAPSAREPAGASPKSPVIIKGSELTKAQAQILEAVRSGLSRVDAICAATGLAVPTVQQHLLTLTLSGVLVSSASGHYSLVNA